MSSRSANVCVWSLADRLLAIAQGSFLPTDIAGIGREIFWLAQTPSPRDRSFSIWQNILDGVLSGRDVGSDAANSFL